MAIDVWIMSLRKYRAMRQVTCDDAKLHATLAAHAIAAGGALWDEASDATAHYELAADGYASLMQAAQWSNQRRWPTAAGRDAQVGKHLACTVLLPISLATPFATAALWDGPPRGQVGSCQAALDELQHRNLPPAADIASDVIRAALQTALQLRLPLIIAT